MKLVKIPASSQFSWSDGLWFIFHDGDRQIAVNASAISGRERVFVNNELVADKRSLGMTSEHQFFFDEITYQVIFKVTNLLTAKLECSLIKDDISIGQFKTSLTNNFSLKLFFIALSLGFLVGYLNLPLWPFAIAGVIVFANTSKQVKINRTI
jgi:hypothetical protein